MRKTDASNPAEDKALLEATRPYGTFDTELAARLHSGVAAMNVDNFLVRPKRLYVERYAERTAWDSIDGEQANEIAQELAGLPSETDPEDITARQFDLLLLNLQLAYLRAEPALFRLQGQVREIAAMLEDKESIPL